MARDALHSRRRFLALAGGLALAGCQGPGDDTQTAAGTPGEMPSPIDPPETEYDLVATREVEEWPAYDPDWAAPTTSPLEADLATEILVENLEIPWDLSFASDGTLFISERVGRVLAFDGGEVRSVLEPDDAIPAGAVEPGEADEDGWWVTGGEGGTLGVAAHPNFADVPLVYVYYTYGPEDERANKVVAFDTAAEDPTADPTTIVDGIPGSNIHNGGRITFGPRNDFWVTCGDGGDSDNPRDLTSLGGKVLRLRPDGTPSPHNPDLGGAADPRIYTYGHRNPQGIVWLPDATPVISEHGPGGRDEVNRLEAGADYGFEEVRKREEYLGEPSVHRPLWNTGGTSVAPTGSLFYTGDAAPSLAGRMLTGGLIGQRLMATTITPAGEELPPAEDGTRYDQDWTDDGYVATRHDFFENEVGRIRHVEQGPDGALYLITSNRDNRAREGFPKEYDDILARITPG
jgi:glucose/arabinose dehydrogenase